ncbi:MAG: SIMPL domain-containing protein [Actinomycetia bacterium]|nr:SIMPL domain-containing protein [Actinomycetes bacterium]
MKITVRGASQAEVPPDLGRLHGQVVLEGMDRQAVVAAVTDAANQLSQDLAERRAAGQAGQVVVRPISVQSQQRYYQDSSEVVHWASVGWSADFPTAEALSAFSAQHSGRAEVQIDRAEWLLSQQTRDRVEQECLTRAVATARTRAAAVAAAAGAGEVRFVEVSDADLGAPDGGVRAAVAYASAESVAVDVQPADITVRVDLRVVFEA